MAEDEVDKRLYNSLKVRFELGLFDPPEGQSYYNISLSEVGKQSTIELNEIMTKESMVLMQNPKLEDGGNGNEQVLPFKLGTSVAVVGPHFNATEALVGNYLGQACPTYLSYDCIVPVLEAVSTVNKEATVVGAEGCTVTTNSTAGFNAALDAADESEAIILAMGINQIVEGGLCACICVLGKPLSH